MKINSFNPSFNGYTNIFADDIKYDGNRSTVLSMQLDNNGEKDLANFKKIKNLVGFSTKEINNDVLSIFYTKINNQRHMLFLNNKRVLWGEELLDISDISRDSCQFDKYKELEKIHLKVYTFLAYITRKISNDFEGKNLNNDLYRTLLYTERNLTKIFNGQEPAVEIIRHGLYTEPQEIPAVAKSLNHKIAATMSKFFR